jgi:hypothetical protein
MKIVKADPRRFDIKKVAQRPMGCLPACISMLTGIDYGLLPNVTVEFNVRAGKILGTADVEPYFSWERGGEALVGSWPDIQAFYRENAGIELAFVSKKPPVASIRVVQGGHHVVVEFADGTIIDPEPSPQPMPERNNFWVTVTPLQGSPLAS